jgi:hypothetical protein
MTPHLWVIEEGNGTKWTPNLWGVALTRKEARKLLVWARGQFPTLVFRIGRYTCDGVLHK